MKRIALTIAVLLVAVLVLASCVSTYPMPEVVPDATPEVAPEVTPEPTPEQVVVELLGNEPVITFVITNMGISVDKILEAKNCHPDGEVDCVYLVKNESDSVIMPAIYYSGYGTIADNSYVEGQGFVDAPPFVSGWVTITPKSVEIPPHSYQAYTVVLMIPKDAPELPKKFAFKVGVAMGGKFQLATEPWWLITMR